MDCEQLSKICIFILQIQLDCTRCTNIKDTFTNLPLLCHGLWYILIFKLHRGWKVKVDPFYFSALFGHLMPKLLPKKLQRIFFFNFVSSDNLVAKYQPNAVTPSKWLQSRYDD